MKQEIEPGKMNENTYLIDVNMLGMEKITGIFVVKNDFRTSIIELDYRWLQNVQKR